MLVACKGKRTRFHDFAIICGTPGTGGHRIWSRKPGEKLLTPLTPFDLAMHMHYFADKGRAAARPFGVFKMGPSTP